MRRLVVVGASLAGFRAIQALRQAGYDGKLALVGAEAHVPYSRPPLSKQLLTGEWRPERHYLGDRKDLSALAVDLHLGCTAHALDLSNQEVVLEGGGRLPFDGLIVATGATPRKLPQAGDLRGIHALRTLDDCREIREAFELRPKVVVVGAGFIGLEAAAAARTRGLDVTVIETMPVPLVRVVGMEMGAQCARLHVDHGVQIRSGVSVAAFEGGERVERVRLQDGSAIDADLVIVGVGVVPETSWLESSGLELADGVVCDSTCAASAPGVYAAGDVARWHNPLFEVSMRIEHWTNAAEQGDAAARALLAGAGKAKPFAPIPYFWSDQYDTKIQFVGRAGPGDEMRVVNGAVDEDRLVAIYGREGRIVGALGFNSPRSVMSYRQLIGERASWDKALARAESLESS